jgi:WD40 repeat protein
VLLALEALENYPYTWQAERMLANIVHQFRLRKILSGHTDKVLDASWSPDGNYLATSGQDGSVRIWDAATGQEILTIAAHPAFLLEVGATDDTGTGHAGTQEVAWSPDGKKLVTAGGKDRTAKVWDAVTGEQIHTFSEHTDWVWSVDWSPDGDRIVTSSRDGTIKVWDAHSGELIHTLSGHTDWVKMVAWSPDGTKLATASDDHTVRTWDSEAGEELLNLTGHTNWVWSVAWSPDGGKVVTAGEDGTVRIFNAGTGEEELSIPLTGAVWRAMWSPDGTQIATSNAGGLGQVWDAAAGTELFELSGRIPNQFDIAWSPDGKWLATTAGADFTGRIWDASPGGSTLSGGHSTVANVIVWSPDGKRLVTAGLEGIGIIWDAATGQNLITLSGHTDEIQIAAWSPEGSRIATTSWDNTAKVWDANTGEELLTFHGHEGEPMGPFINTNAIFGVSWSPDGNRIATAGGSGWVRVWDSRSAEELFAFRTNDRGGPNVEFSPDGKHLSTCVYSPQIWDAATGEAEIGGFVDMSGIDVEDFDWCFGPYWSPTGDRLFTASYGGIATIWDPRTSDQLLNFTGHSFGIWSGSWSPDGKRAATGDDAGVVKVWDTETGDELFSFNPPHAYVWTVDWSPDGSQLAVAGETPNPTVWPVWQSAQDLVTYAKECCVVRELTPDEREQFGLPIE